MTTLTEQLKQGKLPDNHHYYFQMPNGKYEVGNTFFLELLHWCKGGDKIKVLEEVPSYEVWQAKLEENTKLKELLKLAKESVSYHCALCREYTDGQILLDKINQVLKENE